MYRKKDLNSKRVPSTSKQPVYVSQKKNLEKTQEKENEAANRDFVPNSQSEELVIQSSQGLNEATQSKFLSQRHQYRAATQYDTQIRGKNFFEISLISSKVRITDMGKYFY
jgi:L-lactate utilization protein LutC